MRSSSEIHHEISDESLFGQIKLGNQDAYYVLFDRHWERLYRISFLILKNRESAQDVVQEIFLNLWEQRQSKEISNVEHYFARAAKFSSLKVIRDKKIGETENIEALLEHPTEQENTYDEKVLEQKIDQAISDLPERCQEVFRLSRFEQFSNKEIAEKLDLSQRTVETHISNALKHLRKTLPKQRFIQLFLTFFI
ncbi:MAG: RNA polymerase sigma-70 factor [Crocinitomicaceae bacterium]|mgnify:CR=1 FL=1|nr:RNA polymerase sigma-70 factor [Crocinitomicaceae bacterium]|tara:strand:- start:17364 stop:17948 length:585 start_codon:yes stop_codon:yes gene_type:complete